MAKKNQKNKNKLFLSFISFFLLLFSLSLIFFQISKKPKEVKAVAGQLNINAVSGGVQNFNQVGIGGDVTGSSAKLYVNGNVGIGTTSPSDMLDIVAGTNSQANLNLRGGGSITSGRVSGLSLYKGSTLMGSWKLDASGSMQFQVEAGAGSSGNLDFNTAAGTSTIRFWPKANKALELDSETNAVNNLNIRASATGNAPAFYVSGNDTNVNFKIDAKGTGNLLLQTVASGNVGIGTTSPGAKLDVAGSIRSTSGYLQIGNVAPTTYNRIGTSGANFLEDQNDLLVSDELEVRGSFYAFSSSGARLYVTNNAVDIWSTETAPLRLHYSTSGGVYSQLQTNSAGNLYIPSGNVGIGTTGPGQKLDVVGRLRFRSDGASTPGFWLTDNSGTENVFTGLQGTTATSSWGVWSNNAWQFTITNSGNVGIGTTAPNRKLELVNDVSGLSFEAGTGTPNSGVIRFGDNTGWKLHFGRSRNSAGGALNSGTAGVLMTIQDNGNVGIGTTGPGAKLDVAGVQLGYSSTGNYWVDYYLGENADPNPGDIILLIPNPPGTVNAAMIEGTITVSRGSAETFNSLKQWHITASRAYTNLLGSITPLSEDTAMIKLVTCDYGGTKYLGIDTSAIGLSSHKWKFSGSWTNAINTQKPQLVPRSSCTNIADFKTYHSLGNQISISASGNVGIGTTSPNNALHVYRTGFNPGANDLAALRVEGNWGGGIVFSESTGRSGIWSGNGVDLRFGTGGTSGGISQRMIIDSNGNVGIGVTNPSYRLELPNNANASGQGRANAWVTYSDIRFKENITPITNALEKINNLQGVYFDWKKNGKRDIGFIAQEVEPVLPEVVSTDPSGIKSLDYSRLTALLVQGIKEQQSQISSLSSQLDGLSLTSTGNLNIAQTQNGDYQVQNSQTGDIITRLSAFAEIIVGKIKAGLIETKKLIVDGVDIVKKLNELSAKVDSQQKEIEALKEEIKKLKK